MVEPIEQDDLDRARFLREEQEYLDARAAYDIILGQVSSSVPLPYGMQSNYGIATDGPNRAATDPWIRQQHPDLAAAGARVVKEEGEFLALDEPVSSHAQPNCSIATFTSEKIYEYYAALEMVYKIATDDEFRQMIAGQIHSAYTQSAFANQTAADMLKWHAGNLDDDIEEAERRERGDKSLMDRVGSLFGFEDGDELALWLVSDADKQEYDAMSAAELKARRDRLLSEAQIHQDAAMAKLKSFFVKIWDQIKRRYTECGLMYAIITTGIDGGFLAAEFGTGVAVLRGLKFVRKILPSGRFQVELHTIEGRKLGEADWSKEDLAAKYGEPQQTQVGGFEPDANRQIPDMPAEDVPRRGAGRDADPEPEIVPPRRIRSNEELAPGGKVPKASSGRFNEWWDDLSPDELDNLWADGKIRKAIETQVRHPRKLHEWLMVAEGPRLKRLGFSMDEIKAMTSPTRTLDGPYPNGAGGERWRHSPEGGGRGSGPNSGKMHESLRETITNATDRNDLLRKLGAWSRDWLDGGPDGFPPALRDAIRNVSN